MELLLYKSLHVPANRSILALILSWCLCWSSCEERQNLAFIDLAGKSPICIDWLFLTSVLCHIRVYTQYYCFISALTAPVSRKLLSNKANIVGKYMSGAPLMKHFPIGECICTAHLYMQHKRHAFVKGTTPHLESHFRGLMQMSRIISGILNLPSKSITFFC